jgi:hypothetical protein
MIVVLVEFLSIFLLGLASGVSFSHLLQSGPKKALPAPQFLAIQQILLRNYGPTIGGLEVAALFDRGDGYRYVARAGGASPRDPRLHLCPGHGAYLGRMD